MTLKSEQRNDEWLIKKKMPTWVNPMLAVLEHDYFFSSDWLYERKLDGERCLVFKDGKKVKLFTRNKKLLNDQYPELVEAIRRQVMKRCILDGEIVAFKGNVTSFEKLQKRMHVIDGSNHSTVKVFLYLFDSMYFDQWDCTKLSLLERKKLLKKAVAFSGLLRFTPHRLHNTKKYFTQACQKGWEGFMVKRVSSIYEHKRSSNWLKFKCSAEQELVIGGYTDPEGERIGFGALLVGYYQGGVLRYAGKVGTGFSDEVLEQLYKKFKRLEVKKSPFASSDDLPKKKVHWVKPKLVAQIGFTEWTKTNKLRHPRYLGLRDDKDARDVVQEK